MKINHTTTAHRLRQSLPASQKPTIIPDYKLSSNYTAKGASGDYEQKDKRIARELQSPLPTHLSVILMVFARNPGK